MAAFQGKRVSKQWALVLRWAADEGVVFRLNSGQRTMSEQWALYRLYKSGRGNLAAYPSPFAPHIRRVNHALDVNALDGGETRFERWVKSKGVAWKNTVVGEAWHGEVSLSGLMKLYRKARDHFKWEDYTDSERRWIEEYDRLKKLERGSRRVSVLRRVMKEQRKNVYRAAQKDGWNKHNRKRRYASLLSRSL